MSKPNTTPGQPVVPNFGAGYTVPPTPNVPPLFPPIASAELPDPGHALARAQFIASMKARGVSDDQINGLLNGSIVPTVVEPGPPPLTHPLLDAQAPMVPPLQGQAVAGSSPSHIIRVPAVPVFRNGIEEHAHYYQAAAQANGMATPPSPPVAPRPYDPFNPGPDGTAHDGWESHSFAQRAAAWGQTLAGIAALAPMPAAPIAAPVAAPQLGDTPGHVAVSSVEVTFRNK